MSRAWLITGSARGIDAGIARAALAAVTHVEMGPAQISGLYHDRLERRNGRWAFVERKFELHYLTPLPNWKSVAGSEASAA